MDTRHLVDPELAAALDYMPPFEFTHETLPLVRAGLAESAAAAASNSADTSHISVKEYEIAGGSGQPMTVIVYKSPAAEASTSAPVILYSHGGGYIMVTAHLAGGIASELASMTDAVVVSVDYRLAPETPYPGPLEDCYAALRWVHDEAAMLGIDPTRIAVRGESAGAGLAAALALLARDRGGPAIRHQHLVCPMLDDRTCIESDPHPYTGEFIWNAAANRFGWEAMLGQKPGSPDVPAYAAPARATDLSGLPPAFISSGALDLFLEEDLEYARRLMRAGVPTEVHVYPGAYHGFETNAHAKVVKQAKADAAAALRRALFD